MYKICDKPILLDINVQRDLFVPGGTLYQSRHRAAIANIYRLFDWARTAEVPVISSVLLVRRGRRGPLASETHCVEGTSGQSKPVRTLLARRINLGLSFNTDLPFGFFGDFQQVIFETHNADIFNHQKFERLITELAGRYTFVVCGGSIAVGIRQVVLGLRNRRFGVIVAKDAVLDLAHGQTKMAWLQMAAKGARLLPTSQIPSAVSPAASRRFVGEAAVS